jgi:uncharacterized repeat protein (TIGR01451 family)
VLLSIDKFRPHGDVTATSNFWYYIHVYNDSAGTAHNVVVTDNLPGAVAPYSVRLSEGGLFDGVDTATWELGTMAPGDSVYMWIMVNTFSWAAGTEIRNVARVEAPGVATAYAEDVALVQAPPPATPTSTPTATATPMDTLVPMETPQYTPTATGIPQQLVYQLYLPVVMKQVP